MSHKEKPMVHPHDVFWKYTDGTNAKRGSQCLPPEVGRGVTGAHGWGAVVFSSEYPCTVWTLYEKHTLMVYLGSENISNLNIPNMR